MNRQDRIIALIRTAVPTLVGALLTFLVAHMPTVATWIDWVNAQLASVGLPGVMPLVQALVVAAVVGAYYWLARMIGARWPVAERWLLGRSATPSYAVPKAALEPSPSAPTHYGS